MCSGSVTECGSAQVVRKKDLFIYSTMQEIAYGDHPDWPICGIAPGCICSLSERFPGPPGLFRPPVQAVGVPRAPGSSLDSRQEILCNSVSTFTTV